jgi:hypothetical protein
VIQIEEIPRSANIKTCQPLLEMCERIVGRSDVGSFVAFLLTRPGSHREKRRSQLGTRPHRGSSAAGHIYVARAFRQRRRAASLCP